MNFVLDPKLENDSSFICDLQLSQVRLNHNGAFPWIILIPRRKKMVELIDLKIEEQGQLLAEIRQGSQIMRALFQADKLNIANLGNVVSQLHVHIIARFHHDPAWPRLVWDSGLFQPYLPDERRSRIGLLAAAFQGE